MHGALFVAHQNMADTILLENFVVNRQHSAARISEYRVHALIFKGLHHHFRTGHLTCHCLAPF